MKHPDQLPHIALCGFCEQGLLRFMRCNSCTTVVAVCEECELVWLDIAAVKDDPHMPSSSAFPKCPACHSKHAYWSWLTREEIEGSSLVRYVAQPLDTAPGTQVSDNANPDPEPSSQIPETQIPETQRRQPKHRRSGR
jgi:hypothetical protein